MADTGGLTSYDANSSGLFKPDLMMPTCTETASSANDTALRTLCGTSGATPYAAAAAQILQDFYFNGLSFTAAPGNIYSSMIAFGNQAPNRLEGAGRRQLDRATCSRWLAGLDVTWDDDTYDIPFTVGSGESELKVGIWWANPDSGTLNDIDLRVFSGGTLVGSSISTGSSFERVQVGGTLTSGSWTMQIKSPTILGEEQLFYYLVYTRTPC